MSKSAQVPRDPGSGVATAQELSPAGRVASNENKARAGTIARRLVAAVGWIERKNLEGSLHGQREFFDPALFSWVTDLEHSQLSEEPSMSQFTSNPHLPESLVNLFISSFLIVDSTGFPV